MANEVKFNIQLNIGYYSVPQGIGQDEIHVS